MKVPFQDSQQKQSLSTNVSWANYLEAWEAMAKLTFVIKICWILFATTLDMVSM